MNKEKVYSIKDLAQEHGIRSSWIYGKIKKEKYEGHINKEAGVKVLDEDIAIKEIRGVKKEAKKKQILESKIESNLELEEEKKSYIEIINEEILKIYEENQTIIEENENLKNSLADDEVAVALDIEVEIVEIDEIEESLINMPVDFLTGENEIVGILKSENTHLREENIKLLNLVEDQNTIVKREQEITTHALTHSEKLLLLKQEELEIRRAELKKKEGKGIKKFFRKIFS